MADFIRYTPTDYLSSAQRTRSGYYDAIKSWVMAFEPILQYFTVSADVMQCFLILTPKFDNIKNFPLRIEVLASGTVKLLCSCESDVNGTPIWSNTGYSGYDTSTFKNDVTFDIFCDETTFIISNANSNYANYFMITDATNIDTNNKCKACIYMFANYMYMPHAGSTSVEVRDNVYRSMVSQFNYLLRPYGIANTPLLFDKVYGLDAGSTLPNTGRIKINNEYYYKLFRNILFKMD